MIATCRRFHSCLAQLLVAPPLSIPTPTPALLDGLGFSLLRAHRSSLQPGESVQRRRLRVDALELFRPKQSLAGQAVAQASHCARPREAAGLGVADYTE